MVAVELTAGVLKQDCLVDGYATIEAWCRQVIHLLQPNATATAAEYDTAAKLVLCHERGVQQLHTFVSLFVKEKRVISTSKSSAIANALTSDVNLGVLTGVRAVYAPPELVLDYAKVASVACVSVSVSVSVQCS